MAAAIEQLLVLQERDQHIRRLRKEMADIPIRKQQIESRLKAHESGLAEAENNLMALTAKTKALEVEIESAKQQIQRYRDQQLQTKKNDEYKAFEKQIASTMSQIRGLEDQELEAMEQVEAARVQVKERNASLEVDRARVNEEVATFLDRSTGLGDELAKVEEERKALAAGVDPTWLSRYERLFEKKGDAAIAVVEHGTCGCCHMKLPPAQVVDARKGDTLTVCNFCGRLLYSA